jgi:hypothetical protein
LDEVIYADQSPWPSSADGSGLALHRTSEVRSGNDPANWRAAAASPGQVGGTAADSDGDGIPDAWETANGLDPNSPTDAALDPDEDGFDNRQEFQAGTNPRDPASVLRLSGYTAQGAAFLRFTAAAGRAYTLWYRDTLTGGAWVPLEQIPGSTTAQTVEFQDQLPIGTGQRYYRLSAQPSG